MAYTPEQMHDFALTFHEAFRRQDLTPPWNQTSTRYQTAVIAGVHALLKQIGSAQAAKLGTIDDKVRDLQRRLP